MGALEAAQEFLAKAENMESDDLREAYDALPKEVQDLYEKLRKVAYFDPKNAVTDKRWEVLSPSGKYKLVVTPFTTGPGCWNFSQGVVYRKDDDKPIATVQRNYSAFPRLFIEGHPKGDFFVAGEDYQGQTVIELTNGQRRDHMSDGSDKGAGFCWASYRYDSPNQILVVEGCHWACPYEYRFYDFSDPMNGWPEIELEAWIDADARKEPELDPDGTVRSYETRYTDDDEDETTDEEKAKKPKDPIVDVIRTFRRDGLKLKLVEEWVSDYEKDRQVKREEWDRKDKEWTANFRATDPLYLAYVEQMNDPSISGADYESVGQTYDDWGGDWKGKERRWCRRIITHKGKKGPSVDLEWAVETGPIKIVLYRDGSSAGHKFFEHSVEGMKQAFAAAKEFAG
jgi:hypothetical protein